MHSKTVLLLKESISQAEKALKHYTDELKLASDRSKATVIALNIGTLEDMLSMHHSTLASLLENERLAERSPSSLDTQEIDDRALEVLCDAAMIRMPSA